MSLSIETACLGSSRTCSHEMRLDHPRASCARFASISLSTLVSDTAAHDLASVRRTSWKCQTATATPAVTAGLANCDDCVLRSEPEPSDEGLHKRRNAMSE